MNRSSTGDTANSRVILVGGGIASLASAFYLIRDAGIDPLKITVLEQESTLGGSLDGGGDPETGFLVRGGRMHEEQFRCYWDLLSHIPSFDDPAVSVRDETFAFNREFVSNAKARLLKAGEILPGNGFGLAFQDRLALIRLSLTPESKLDNLRISDWFDERFFRSRFWFYWATTFAFQPWSGVAQMRRYMRRFIHLFEGLPRLRGILRTRYNQYHSVVLPLQRYLEGKGVRFSLQTRVVDVEFELGTDSKTARAIKLEQNGRPETLPLSPTDYVFITNGSIVDQSSQGSWSRAPILETGLSSPSWSLWKSIAGKDPAFGNPDVFCAHIDKQKWYSFTVTLADRTFHDHMQSFTGNVDGTGGLVTLTDSSWLMSVVIARQPHFPNQPDNVKVFWGYGLFPDRVGDFVKKKMSECSGEEILEELWQHLRVDELMAPIMKAGRINCIPVAMPFIDSLFMPCARGDRPQVLPSGARNFAFLGQFAEVPVDCVFTVEYSVRTAQTAVYGLFDTGLSAPPVYDSIHKPGVLFSAFRALNR